MHRLHISHLPCRYMLLVLFMGLSLSSIHAQYHGGLGDGNASNRFLGFLPGISIDGMFRGGAGDGFKQSYASGALQGIALSTIYAGGNGDGFRQNRFLGSLQGASTTILYMGGPSDGFDQFYNRSMLETQVGPPVHLQPLQHQVADLLIYPNPFSGDQLSIRLEGVPLRSAVIIEVTDMFGRSFLSEKINSNSSTLRHQLRFKQKLAAGVYVVSISGPLRRSKLVVKR